MRDPRKLFLQSFYKFAIRES